MGRDEGTRGGGRPLSGKARVLAIGWAGCRGAVAVGGDTKTILWWVGGESRRGDEDARRVRVGRVDGGTLQRVWGEEEGKGGGG